MKKYQNFRDHLKLRGEYDPSCVSEGLTDTAGGGGAGGSIRGVYNSHHGTDLNGIGDGSRNPRHLNNPEVLRTLVKGINLELGGPHSHTVVPMQKAIQKLAVSGLSLPQTPTKDLEPGEYRMPLEYNKTYDTGVDFGAAFEEEEFPSLELVITVSELENGLGIEADIVNA